MQDAAEDEDNSGSDNDDDQEEEDEGDDDDQGSDGGDDDDQEEAESPSVQRMQNRKVDRDTLGPDGGVESPRVVVAHRDVAHGDVHGHHSMELGPQPRNT